MRRAHFLLLFTLVAHSLFGSGSDALSMALKLVSDKKHDEARLELMKLHEKDPANIDIHYALAQAAIARNDPDDAIRWAENCAHSDAMSARYQLTLGDAHGMKALRAGLMEKLEAAKQCRIAYEKAVELEPANSRARRALAEFYWQAPGLVGGGKSKAYIQAEALCAAKPDDGIRLLTDLYFKEQRYDDIIKASLPFLEKSPDHTPTLWALARACAQSGQQPEKGTAALKHYLTLPPPSKAPAPSHVHLCLGQLYEHLKDFSAAKAAYEQALQLQPDLKPAAEAHARLSPPK